MANLEVNAEDLAKDGEEYTNLAAVAKSINDYLASGAALITFPQGDPVSAAFSEQWNKIVSGAQALFEGFAAGMTGVSSKVISTAALYQKSNDVNTGIVAPPTILE
jgi:hypothetical protein